MASRVSRRRRGAQEGGRSSAPARGGGGEGARGARGGGGRDAKGGGVALTPNGVWGGATGQVFPGVASKLDASSAAWVGLSVGMLRALGVQPGAVPPAPAVPAPTKA